VIDSADREFLVEAVKFLEHPSLAIRIANSVGKPVEFLHEKLPEKYRNMLSSAVNASLLKCVEVAVKSIPQNSAADANIGILNKSRLHVATASGLGALGGFVGLASIPIELPITTTIMLRSIAEIAKENGEDLSQPEALLECIQVFAMGARESADDDSVNSAYLQSRIAFSNLVNKSAQFMARHSAREVLSAIEKKTAPDLVLFISRIAARFKIVVSEKMVAQIVPILGAIGAAALNGFFTDHFNNVAHYHYGIKKLERKYGLKIVQDEIERLSSN
jgi:hypothetical protein